MSENDGGPAFPETRWDDKARQEVQWCGMTLRDYFAAKAMQGMLATIRPDEEPLIGPIAEEAYRMADAMLAERDK